MAAWFMFTILPRLLNMNMCKGFTSCMAAMRSNFVHTVLSMTCMIAVSTMVADVCTLIGWKRHTYRINTGLYIGSSSWILWRGINILQHILTRCR